MDKKEAIDYLRGKGKIKDKDYDEYSEEDKKKIDEVVKKGKIYGDPLVEIEA